MKPEKGLKLRRCVSGCVHEDMHMGKSKIGPHRLARSHLDAEVRTHSPNAYIATQLVLPASRHIQ